MVQNVINRIDPAQRATLAQLVRYGLAGGIITLLVAASYWAIAEFARVDPMVSLTIVFIFFSGVSYLTHGAFTFKGHGERDRQHVRAIRFLAINLLGFLMNQLFVWTLVKQMGGPTWWPTLPMIFVTPLVTFALHRRYVYA